MTGPGGAPEAVFERVLAANPFIDNRVNGPAAPTSPDVASVHGNIFRRLTDLAEEALRSRRGVGAVLWGEAGIGKSHLLARLGRWADGSLDGAKRRADFVLLHNLQSAPDYLPRAILRTAVAALTAGQAAASLRTPLFDLVRAGVFASVNHQLHGYTWAQVESAFLRWARQAAHDSLVPGDVDLHRVLLRYFRSAVRTRQGKDDGVEARLAVRWFSGQPLDADEAHLLDLPVRHADEPVALADNQAIKETLVALCRLAAVRGRPFILAFDQVDNLDDDQFAALARFLEALIDAAPNLFVVTAGIQTTLLHWKEQQIVQESAWHRLGQFELQLRRLPVEQALELVQSRLDRVFEGRRDHDALFPLGQAWRRTFVASRTDVRPRDAINSAREAWRLEQELLREQGALEWLRTWPVRQQLGEVPRDRPTDDEIQTAVDQRVTEYLAEHRDRCRDDAAALPPDGDRLAGLIYNLLRQCREADEALRLVDVERVSTRRGGGRPGFDVIFARLEAENGPAVRTGLLVLVESRAGSVTARLRRLVNEPPPVDRAVLVTDERIGLPLGAAGQNYLHQLSQRWPEHFRRVRLTVADLVEMEGLQAVVSASVSGDLEVQLRPDASHPLTRAEVLSSHRRHGRYVASPLLRELLEAYPSEKTATSRDRQGA